MISLQKQMKVVICGGGIMGVSTAYYLAERGVGSVIIEQKAIACGASGNAGGFLAREWCDHYEVGPIARFSYDLHVALSQTLKDCDYRCLDTFEVDVDGSGARKKHDKLSKWVDGRIGKVNGLGTTKNTAQVRCH